ncbi:B-cell receptor CD22-like [Alosa pseudoharengus]|uniref:B-cell receptor CD22-like n=1 Tax=Alosa pseudoharengus TaxID=34774 RepID=UPI003F886373
MFLSDAPRNTSVLAHPSGEPVEGSSVTLTCSSDANPPAHSYTWYKENGHRSSQVGRSQNHSFVNISSEQSGLYYCVAENGIGQNRSSVVQINVTYAPRNTSVSVSPSGDIEEGSSVTLTCSSDANPPVHTYTWYRRKHGSESTWIGRGQTYSITNVSTEHSGLYYCKAENKHGASHSNTTFLDVFSSGLRSTILFSALGAILAVTLLLVIGIVCWRRQKTNSAKTVKNTHSNTKEVSNLACCDTTMDCGTGQIDAADRKDDDDGVQYASVQFKPNKQQEVPSQEEDIQYASVQFSKSKPESTISEPPLSGMPQEETQYASLNLQGLSAAPQTGAESVIYSAINTHSKP